jgi:hypothetical protein
VDKFGLDSSGSRCGPVASCYEYENDPLGSIKGRGFFDDLSELWDSKEVLCSGRQSWNSWPSPHMRSNISIKILMLLKLNRFKQIKYRFEMIAHFKLTGENYRRKKNIICITNIAVLSSLTQERWRMQNVPHSKGNMANTILAIKVTKWDMHGY